MKELVDILTSRRLDVKEGNHKWGCGRVRLGDENGAERAWVTWSTGAHTGRMAWEHVGAEAAGRALTAEETRALIDLFFEPEEAELVEIVRDEKGNKLHLWHQRGARK